MKGYNCVKIAQGSSEIHMLSTETTVLAMSFLTNNILCALSIMETEVWIKNFGPDKITKLQYRVTFLVDSIWYTHFPQWL